MKAGKVYRKEDIDLARDKVVNPGLGANKSRSETTSTSGSRNVMVWPKYDKNGELEHIYMVILNGDYKNISTEFRRD